MGADDGGKRSSNSRRSRLEQTSAEIASVIARELHVRDELLMLLQEMESVPLEGPRAEDFREHMADTAPELRPMIEGRMAYLRSMPDIASLVASVDLDHPDADAETRQLALMVEGAAACFAAFAAQVEVLAAMRRRGLPV